mmetsp:Transcript_3741/g.10305  ORF Transcript_3741/g.10305 Transcript_3741/m.10305 type:complete len:201 (+) Transcript_3741:260-862(+)
MLSRIRPLVRVVFLLPVAVVDCRAILVLPGPRELAYPRQCFLIAIGQQQQRHPPLWRLLLLRHHCPRAWFCAVWPWQRWVPACYCRMLLQLLGVVVVVPLPLLHHHSPLTVRFVFAPTGPLDRPWNCCHPRLVFWAAVWREHRVSLGVVHCCRWAWSTMTTTLLARLGSLLLRWMLVAFSSWPPPPPIHSERRLRQTWWL